MVLIAKSFLVKVLMEVQKKLYLSSYFLLRKAHILNAPQNQDMFVCVGEGIMKQLKFFSCRYPSFSLSFSLQWCLYAVLRIFSGS